jgi:molecular chaperone GrpE
MSADMSKEKKIAIATEADVARFAPGEQPAPAPDADTAAGEAASASEAGAIESLKAQLAECQDKLLRAQAECANIAKRLGQQHEEALRLAPMPLARDLLHVLDSLERTLRSLGGARADDPVAQGVKLVADQLMKVLKDHGVEPIDAVGRPFDPARHEAMMVDPSSDLPHRTVISEFQRGYLIRGRMLRPARVVVSGDEEKAAESAPQAAPGLDDVA